ncbi:MAG: glycosyltransferase family 4 protein [Chloroflexota bacterium]
MRILILVDKAVDLDSASYVDALDVSGVRRYVARIVPRFDPERIQIQQRALRDTHSQQADPAISFNARHLFDVAAWRRLLQFLHTQDIELIHALGLNAAVFAAIAGGIVGIPTLASFESLADFNAVGYIPQMQQRVKQLILRCGIDHVIVPSMVLRKNFWRVNYPQARIEVVYRGVDLRPAEAPVLARAALGLPEGPLVTMIAPLVPDQGYNLLIDMMRRLLQRVPEAHLAIVGSGVLAQELYRKTHYLPIVWLGERSDIREIIAASDTIVVHPRQPGIPSVILEAAAAGKPVIASRASGINEVIEHGVNGLQVTYGDSPDLAVQISRVLSQPSFQQSLGAAAQQKARSQFSLEVQRDTMTILYESTVYGRR